MSVSCPDAGRWLEVTASNTVITVRRIADRIRFMISAAPGKDLCLQNILQFHARPTIVLDQQHSEVSCRPKRRVAPPNLRKSAQSVDTSFVRQRGRERNEKGLSTDCAGFTDYVFRALP